MGWSLSPTLHPLLGDLLSGEPGLLVEAPNPLLSSDVMATGHLDRSVRSAVIKHIGTSDVLLMVPLKTSDVPSLEMRSASGRLL
jgi:hypothetical protein